MKYLKKFESLDEKAEWQLSEEYVTPNVILVGDALYYDVPQYYYGVTIQHVNGNLFTQEEWIELGYSNDEANGVAFINETLRFVISKNALPATTWAADTSTLLGDIFPGNGPGNTAVLAALGPTGAAYACANYRFPNGSAGYLPTLRELNATFNNLTEISSAMELIGGDTLIAETWSCIEYDAKYAFIHTMTSNTSAQRRKSYNKTPRPFAVL